MTITTMKRIKTISSAKAYSLAHDWETAKVRSVQTQEKAANIEKIFDVLDARMSFIFSLKSLHTNLLSCHFDRLTPTCFPTNSIHFYVNAGMFPTFDVFVGKTT